MYMYNFPPCTCGDGVSLDIDHLISEVFEVEQAWEDREGRHRVCVELMDVIHMAETTFRDMLMKPEELARAYSEVLEKNEERGYYG